MSEKLQKVLARAGLGSRRQAEEWIRAGRVSVDGTAATLGERVAGSEDIRVDGQRVNTHSESELEHRVLIYHKQPGEVSSRKDPENRPTIFDHLPRLQDKRWVQVGRLDFNTSGLMLFTTDGELAHRLMHPSHEFVREYAVRVHGTLTDEKRRAMLDGVELEDGVSRFQSLYDAGGGEDSVNRWYKVTLVGGKYREVRRLFESQELEVARLIRTRFGDIQLPKDLRRGRWMDMPAEQIRHLTEQVELKGKQYSGLYGRARHRNANRKDRRGRAPRKPRRSPYQK